MNTRGHPIAPDPEIILQRRWFFSYGLEVLLVCVVVWVSLPFITIALAWAGFVSPITGTVLTAIPGAFCVAATLLSLFGIGPRHVWCEAPGLLVSGDLRRPRRRTVCMSICDGDAAVDTVRGERCLVVGPGPGLTLSLRRFVDADGNRVLTRFAAAQRRWLDQRGLASPADARARRVHLLTCRARPRTLARIAIEQAGVLAFVLAVVWVYAWAAMGPADIGVGAFVCIAAGALGVPIAFYRAIVAWHVSANVWVDALGIVWVDEDLPANNATAWWRAPELDARVTQRWGATFVELNGPRFKRRLRLHDGYDDADPQRVLARFAAARHQACAVDPVVRPAAVTPQPPHTGAPGSPIG